MTSKDKELLLKDLCTRLPYHTRVKIWLKDGTTEEGPLDLEHNYGDVLRDAFYYNEIVKIKPYLFPMSSMTKEQKREYNNLQCYVPIYYYEYKELVEEIELHPTLESFEYLIKNHFDFRGLIKKGLAIDATGLNIY